MKRLLAVILSAVMLLSMAVPAFAAERDEHPTIYITGAQTNEIYSADGKMIYPLPEELDAMEIIGDALGPCLKQLALGFVTNNYEPYAQEFYNVFVPIFKDISLDENGEVANGSHPKFTIYNAGVAKKTSNYGPWDYRFWYDWRISPMVVADQLKEYIDMVLEATGEEKVNITGRCYGANVIAAYLVKYEDHALETVDDISYLASSVLGIDVLTALFAGEVEIEAAALENFAKYFLEEEELIADEGLRFFVLTLVELLNEIKLLGVTGDLLEGIFDKIKTDLIPLILRDTFASMPSFWSMITPEKYEQARAFIYNGCEDKYKNIIAKNDDFYYNVQLKTEDQMVSLKNKGIGFHIFVKYNFPDYPIYSGATAEGDGNTSAVRQGFGGTYAPYGEVLSDEFISTLKDTKYLSPDKKVDASTCLFPENTWFIKNLHHDKFPNVINIFAMDIMNSDMNVSDGEFKQYQYYFDGTLTPLEDVTEAPKEEERGFFRLFIDFWKSLFEIIGRLFSGELSI